MTNANLTGANLTGANLTAAYLTSARLANATLSAATLSAANLNAANLTGATLNAANLTDADLSNADLANADLTNANLYDTTLSGAILEDAFLYDSNLAGAYLGKANLRGASLQGARPNGRNLVGHYLPGRHEQQQRCRLYVQRPPHSLTATQRDAPGPGIGGHPCLPVLWTDRPLRTHHPHRAHRSRLLACSLAGTSALSCHRKRERSRLSGPRASSWKGIDMAHARTGGKVQTWGGHLGRLTMATVALAAVLATGANATFAPAGAAVTTARDACSLLTHSQVAAILDASHFNETISTPQHCSWDTPGPEITSNGAQLAVQPVSVTNTLASGPNSEVRNGCGHYVIKHFAEPGITGYYCIFPEAIPGAQLFAQEGKIRIWIPIISMEYLATP